VKEIVGCTENELDRVQSAPITISLREGGHADDQVPERRDAFRLCPFPQFLFDIADKAFFARRIYWESRILNACCQN
jgi:hypothetical protein